MSFDCGFGIVDLGFRIGVDWFQVSVHLLAAEAASLI
jgi:hypothetical protein